VAVSGGTFVPLDPQGVTVANYQEQIKSTLGVSDARAAAIAGEYPLASYPSATIAFTALVGEANFACTALQPPLCSRSRRAAGSTSQKSLKHLDHELLTH